MTELTEKSARELTRHIVKNSKDVIVKQGKTNGQIVLHVISTSLRQSRTIRSLGEWEEHPANETARRNDRFAKEQTNERLVTGNKGLST
jgi:hypothetical protein